MKTTNSIALAALGAALLTTSSAMAQVPHRSFERISFSNGHAVASFNFDTGRIDTLLEHPYRFFEPNNPGAPDLCFHADESRDLLFDTYFGVRVTADTTTTNEWLAELPHPQDDGLRPHLLPGTGILHTVQQAAGGAVLVETDSFLPMGFEAPVLVQLLTVRNNSVGPVDVTPFSLMNARLGNAFGQRDPSTDNEGVAYDMMRETFYEYSDDSQGTMAFVALDTVAHASSTPGVGSAYNTVLAGGDLDDVRNNTGNDLAPGFQGTTTTLAPDATVTFAVAQVWALDEDAAPDVDAFRAWWTTQGGTASAVRDAEVQSWMSWHTPAPMGVDDVMWLNANAVLRMGQVREPGTGFGQVLASLPPGNGDINAQWNISWVRDMAYATAGLARAGHLDEARDALLFQLQAPQGLHTAEVGMPYRISITRYFGNGVEESDCNHNGPNIEFDGFGLFLWSLGEYLRAGGDPEVFRPHWDILDDEIGAVLLALREPNGILQADSSIWEVHWNGQQRHFAYTSLAGVRGLCDLAELAERLGMTTEAAQYEAAGAAMRDAVMQAFVDDNGVMAQSTEDLAQGHHYADAATVEAVNWGVVSPTGLVAQSTMSFLQDELTVPTGIGIMRNDDGGDYDSQEWVFVDLRLAAALKAGGDVATAALIRQWVEAQTEANHHHFAELYDRDNGDYRGSTPMVGFGPGAWILATLDVVNDAACGAYGERPDLQGDAGVQPDAGASAPDAGEEPDAGMGVDAGGGEDAGGPAADAGATPNDSGVDVDSGVAQDGGENEDAGAPPADGGDVDGGDVDGGEEDGGTSEPAPEPTEPEPGVSLEPDPQPDDAEADCSCEATSSSTPAGGWLLVMAGLMWRRRQRRCAEKCARKAS